MFFLTPKHPSLVLFLVYVFEMVLYVFGIFVSMLQKVAEIMRLRFGEEHTYRIGGDEFVALPSRVRKTGNWTLANL